MHMTKLTDFPTYLYAFGLFLLIYAVVAQVVVDDLWDKPPQKWIELRSIDLRPPDLQEDLAAFCAEEPRTIVLQEKLGIFYATAGQDFPSWWPGCLKEKGIEQRKSWVSRMNDCYSEYKISEKRLAALKKMLDPSLSPLLLASRGNYEEEKRLYGTLKTKIEKLKIRPAKEGFAKMIAVYLLVLGVFITSSFYLYRLSRAHISQEMVLTRWKVSYWTFVLTLYLCQTLVVCYTSIWKVEKNWIGASSFFVSWNAWYWERIGIFGLSMIMAIPLAQLWCYLRKDFIPEIPVAWVRGPDHTFAIEKYMLFLQTWTLIIFGSFSVITIGAVRWAASQQAEFENAYLINTVVGGGLAGIMILKMIRNAIVLRRSYQDCLARNFSSWGSIKDAVVPPDPTKDFIGESWWKLPVNFVGIVTAAWALLEFTGVAKLLVGLLK
jgi:hypothetical protein